MCIYELQVWVQNIFYCSNCIDTVQYWSGEAWTHFLGTPFFSHIGAEGERQTFYREREARVINYQKFSFIIFLNQSLKAEENNIFCSIEDSPHLDVCFYHNRSLKKSKRRGDSYTIYVLSVTLIPCRGKDLPCWGGFRVLGQLCLAFWWNQRKRRSCFDRCICQIHQPKH